MNISVCIGSACHLKGSYTIINLLKEAVVRNGLGDKVEVSAAFCLGQCSSEGVSVRFGDDVITGISPENFEQVFAERVLNAVE